MEAIRSRKTYDSKDRLILITSDHGGEERITFLVSNKIIPFEKEQSK